MAGKVRLSGLISGMDTDSIISQLVSVKKVKVDKAIKDQTKLSWKQEAWTDINKMMKGLQTTISNMRFSTAFQKKKTVVSNPNKASVITDGASPTSVQSLKINQLAKTAYVTGGTVAREDGKKADALTKLGDLGFTGNGEIKIAGSDKSLTVNANTSINDVINHFQKEGLNASFDKDSQRLFISAKTSGKAADFDIVSGSGEGNAALAKLGLQTADYYTGMAGKDADTIANEADSVAATRAQYYASQYQSLYNSLHTKPTSEADITAKYADDSEVDLSDLDATSTKLQDSLKEMNKSLKEKESALEKMQKDKENLEKVDTSVLTEDEKTEHEKKLADLESQIGDTQTEVEQLKSDVDAKQAVIDDIADLKSLGKMKEITEKVDLSLEEDGSVSFDAETGFGVTAKQSLVDDVKAEITKRVDDAKKEAGDADTTRFATKIKGTDAQIELNGARFNSSTNVFKVNGLTITTNATTEPGEELTLTTQNDTSGIMDVVKDFVKKYNEVINKLDTLYNADRAKGYEPLTDEEKDAMSDSEVEKYEKKIKDSLLKGDSNINTITQALTSVISQGYKIGGQTLYLSDFGVGTLDYFASKDNEKNMLHIDGDEDDADTSTKTNKLAELIASDPDKVSSFFNKFTQDLYSKMDKMSRSVNGYRTFGSFYDDKEMKKDYDSYKDKIKDLEDKMNAYEDKLYKQYSKMESAMAKLQSKTNALGAYLGTGTK